MLRAAPSAKGASGAPYVLGASGVAVSHTGNTNETTLATVAIPANSLGPNGIIEVYTQWSWTASANGKTARVRLGGVSGTIFCAMAAQASSASLRDFRAIQNRNATNSQIGGASAVQFANTSGAVVTGSIDTTAAVDLVISGQLSDGTETIALQSYWVKVTYLA